MSVAGSSPVTAPFHLGHRPALDGLRGLAVAIVVLYHSASYLWPRPPEWRLHGGFLGVDLFFVLSGFLITVLLLGEADRQGGVSLGGFALRRTRRLVPVLVAVFLVTLALALAGLAYTTDTVLGAAPSLVTFTHNWAAADFRTGFLGHLWSVSVEAQFYVLWAVVVVLALRARRPHVVLVVVAMAGVVAVVAWRAYLIDNGTSSFVLYLRTSTRLDAPLVGAIAGVVASAGWLPWFRGKVATAVGSVGLVLVVYAVVVADLTDVVLYRGGYTAIALCVAALVLAVVRAAEGHLATALSSRALVAAGLVSYSLYVWHLPVFEIVADNTPHWALYLRVVVALGISLVLAVLSYRLIERPFLRRRPG